MVIRKLCVTSLLLGVVVTVSCGTSDSGKKGGGVGTKCTANSDCTGYAKPSCLTDLKPLETLVAPNSGKAGDVFKTLDVPFPGGYCSNTIADSCQADTDCGTGGGCYRPLVGVKSDVLSALDATVKVFSVTDFASKGLCLVPCTSDAECRTSEGYKCLLPLEAFIKVVNPPYKNTYCMQDVDVSYLLIGGDGGP